MAPAPPKETKDYLAPARAFLEDVRKLDPGELAALRRNAGETLADSHGALWMYRLLQRHTTDRNFDKYFFTATLLALDKKALRGAGFMASGDLGISMAQLAKKFSQEAIERRFNVLLDSSFDSGEMSFRMPQIVKMLTTSDISINWPQLLSDLLFWNDSQRRVQKRWASHFFDPAGNTAEPESALPSETE